MHGMFGKPVCLALGSILSMLAVGATRPPPVLPPAADFAAEVISGRINPETFDFAGHGYFDLPPQGRSDWSNAVGSALFGKLPELPACSPESQRVFPGGAWTHMLPKAATAADWQLNARALRDKLATLDAKLAEAVAAAPAQDERTRELFARYARDQRIRGIFTEPEWTQGMPPLAAQHWPQVSIPRMGAIDCDNTAWLKTQLVRVGWFDIPTYGADADSAAWHLVQHADNTPAFQREMLARLHALPKGHTDPKRIAYLHDRVARGQQQLQRYGTQGQCGPDGIWKPFDSEDPERLDERRAALGMEPIAEHAKVVSRVACPK